MTRPLDPARITDALVKEARTITATGRIVGTWGTQSGVVVAICLPPGERIDVHPA